MEPSSPTSPLNVALQEDVAAILERIREPLGLDRWNIIIANGKNTDENGNEFRGGCSADPEYSAATIRLDMDAMKTGDDLEEIVIHEAIHAHIWWLMVVAENLAEAFARSAPKSHRAAIRAFAQEQVRRALEKTTTDLGHAFLRLFRRMWDAERRAQGTHPLPNPSRCR